MPMMPHAPVITHPTWCRSTHAGDPLPDHLHDGPAETIRCADDDYELGVQLSRLGDDPTGIVLQATSLSSQTMSGEPIQTRPFLTPADARVLAGLLVAFADAAELAGVEVAW